MAKTMVIIKNKRTVPRRPRTVNTSIPAALASRVIQNSQNRVHTEVAREIVTPFVMSSTSKPGDVSSYALNPASMSGTRIQRLSANYQQYRFKRAAITMQSPASTTASGLYAIGYTRNPDQEIGSGTQAIQTITAMPGAATSSVWNTTTTHASLDSKWYNIDADSLEIMDTTQGFFSACVITPPTATASVSFAVWLDYTIEFRGNAVQRLPSTFSLFPAGTWTRVGTTNTATFTADAGEPAFPTTDVNVTYTVNPTWAITDTNGTLTTARAAAKTTQANNPWFFYPSADAASQQNGAINIPATFTTERTILSKAP